MVLLLVQSCCSFLGASGGGPLTRQELGDWAGIPARAAPAPEELGPRLDALKAIPLPSFRPGRGEYAYTEGPHWLSTAIPDPWDSPFVPARGYVVKGTFPLWRRAVPCTRRGHFVYYAPSGAARELYALEEQWGCGLFVGDFIWSSERADAYDVASRQRVAASTMGCVLGWGVGWSRLRRVVPTTSVGGPGLHAAADRKISLSDIRYDVREGNSVLLGLVGWGRVNRRRYAQVLWIPVPIGPARVTLFDGGHESGMPAAVGWLAAQEKEGRTR